MKAFSDAGVDPDFYTVRERTENELMPWDFVNVGVRRSFLYREYKNAFENKLSPDCRKQCMGCGANCFIGGGNCDA